MFAGPDGRLEGRYHHSKDTGAPLALILHPHPLHGGTMNNRISYTMYQSFQKLGFSVMRFNFRGAGRSQGRYDGGIGEISDAAAALDWMQAVNPNHGGLWISGYSFGAFVGMQLLMRRPEISGWVSVAPPANHYDFGFLAPCPCSGLMLHGDSDELVPEPAAEPASEPWATVQSIAASPGTKKYSPPFSVTNRGSSYSVRTSPSAQGMANVAPRRLGPLAVLSVSPAIGS